MNKKKILLIGATGLLGDYFYKSLKKNKNIKLLICADNNLKNEGQLDSKEIKSIRELIEGFILSPTGGEILTSGEETVIEWNIVESNIQFIDTVGVYHSIDAGETWSLKESWSSSEIPISFIFEIISPLF